MTAHCCAPSSWYEVPTWMTPPVRELDDELTVSLAAGAERFVVGALGFSVELTVDDARLAEAARALTVDIRRGGAAPHRLAVVDGRDGHFDLVTDGTHVAQVGLTPGEVPGMLNWFFNQGVIHHPGDRLLFHAAALTRGDDGVLVAAPSGSGKSTLAASLITAGLDYLSDEVGALDPSSMRLHAYPKSLSLGMSSLELLGLEARVPAALTAVSAIEGQLPASSIRAGSTAASCRPQVVCFPRLERGEPSSLSALRRSETLSRLVPNSFNFVERPHDLFEVCVELCRMVDGYDLVVGDPASATALVAGLLGVGSAGRAASPPVGVP